jgi:NAD(P)-dependent dehydrogenase (short-subunit alcohol dehydrogenase family)
LRRIVTLLPVNYVKVQSSRSERGANFEITVRRVILPAQNLGSFTERVALVTNGARGVGRAVALQLALSGAYVVAHYDAADEASAHVIQQLEEIGTLGRGATGDITSAAGAAAVVAQVEAVYGRLDMLVHVAPAIIAPPLEEITEALWRQTLAESPGGAFFCAQAALPLLRARPSPCIVNVMPQTAGAAGAAARAALLGLTRHLAGELAPRVRVNGVLAQGEPPADEVARACYYFLSAEAKHITGETLTVKPRL